MLANIPIAALITVPNILSRSGNSEIVFISFGLICRDEYDIKSKTILYKVMENCSTNPTIDFGLKLIGSLANRKLSSTIQQLLR